MFIFAVLGDLAGLRPLTVTCWWGRSGIRDGYNAIKTTIRNAFQASGC